MIASIGKVLLLLGLLLAVLGLVLVLTDKPGLWQDLWDRLPLGRLPGDVHIQGKRFSLYFPWVTCLVVSLVASLLLWLFRK